MKHLNLISFLKIFLICLSPVLILSCSEDPIEEELPGLDLVAGEDPRIIKDQYIVLISKLPGKKDPRAEAALNALSKEVGQMPDAKMKGIYRHSITGFVVKMNPAQAKKLEQDSRVISVTPDRYVDLNESDLENIATIQEYATWGLDRVDQREGLLDRAYAYTNTGTGVHAYIMDSGINFSHNDFVGRASLGVDLVRLYPDPEYDLDDPEVEDGGDCNGHGSHVAGTVGGAAFGVAKNVELVSVRVFSCYGRTTWSRIIHAVDWITQNAVKPAVVNMSLGDVGVIEVVHTAIEGSIQSGIHYVVAAGNSNMNACEYTPAGIPAVITVGASDINNKRANFSNYGSCLDLYGPGVSITSAGISDDTSTRLMSGTSMAAPHVTGITALYLESNPEATPGQVHEAIVNNSSAEVILEVPSGPSNMAHSIWEPVVFDPPLHPDLNLRVYGKKQRGGSEIHLVWDPTNDPKINIYKNGSYFMQASNTGEFSFNVGGKGSDSYKICEVNYANCSQEVTPDFDGGSTFEPNQPPVADFTFEVNDLEVTFTDASYDGDGNIIRTRLDFGDGYYVNTGSYTYTYKAPGTYTASLFVTDNHEQSSVINKQITVGDVENLPNAFVLSAKGYKEKGQWKTELSWDPAGTYENVDLYRNGIYEGTIEDTGYFTDNLYLKGGGSIIYKICAPQNTGVCSNEVEVQF